MAKKAAKTANKPTKKAKRAKPKKKSTVLEKVKKGAEVAGTIIGRVGWGILVGVLSAATGLPANTFRPDQKLAEFGFPNPLSKVGLAQRLRDRGVQINDAPIVVSQTLGQAADAIDDALERAS